MILFPTGRSRANLPIQVAQEHDAISPADPFLVDPEVLLGMSFPQHLQHLVGQLSQGQFFVARDLQLAITCSKCGFQMWRSAAGTWLLAKSTTSPPAISQ